MLIKARKSRPHDATQELFPAREFVGDAIERMKSASETERGAIFTKTEVVDFMFTPKMRGGCLRFQAQYLRRIRLPHWQNVPPEARKILTRKNGGTTSDAIQQAVAAAYGLTRAEQTRLRTSTDDRNPCVTPVPDHLAAAVRHGEARSGPSIFGKSGSSALSASRPAAIPL